MKLCRSSPPDAMKPVIVRAYTMTTCLGRGIEAQRRALHDSRSGLAQCRFESVELETCIGEIAGLDDQALPAHLAAFDCRNNRAAEMALAQDGFLETVAEAAAKHG